MSELKIADRLNHVAYVTTDTGATYRFYTEIMGFKLVAAAVSYTHLRAHET